MKDIRNICLIFIEEKIRRESLAEEQRIEKGKLIGLHGYFWWT